MDGRHLAIHAGEAPSFKLSDERDQRNLRRVGHSTEHRLSEKHPAEAHPVQAADQPAVGPGLDRVCVADVKEALVGIRHLVRDPGTILAASRLGAPPHDLLEAIVQRDLQAAGTKRLAQRARDMDLIREQHHSRVGTPPQDRIFITEPGKDAVGVRIEQTLRRQIGTRRQEAIRISQCVRHGRKRIVRTEKGNHVSLIISPLLRPHLTTLEAAIRAPIVTRFAPSPTGFLHLGHVVNAIYVWGIARVLGGSVLLRIEDHDRIRCRPEYESAILEDLDWLGFEPDGGRLPLLRQSETPDAYERALDGLRASTHVYACECSRKDIGGERYDGRCRTRGLDVRPGRGIRVQLDDDAEYFDDGLLGPLSQVPAEQCGDLLLRDRDGHWTYQFSVTVDDLRQRVTLVIRGADLVSSTGRQIQLARMMGRRNAPVFVHHPLIHDDQGEKLSKSAGDTGVRELRAAGLTASDVIGIAASRVGLVETHESIPASEVSRLFEPGTWKPKLGTCDP